MVRSLHFVNHGRIRSGYEIDLATYPQCNFPLFQLTGLSICINSIPLNHVLQVLLNFTVFSNFISIELKFPAYFIIIWVILVIHWIFNYLPDQQQCSTLSKEPEMSMCK